MTASKTGSAHGTSAASKPRKSAAGTQDEGVLAVLTKDHRDVKKLFSAYQRLVDTDAPASQRRISAEQICAMLTAHASVEEELFYPAVRDAAGDATQTMDEAQVEHASLKALIAQLQSMEPNEALYDAKVKVLGEYVDHHVKEEEGEIFPAARKAGIDLQRLGVQVAARKEELLGTSVH